MGIINLVIVFLVKKGGNKMANDIPRINVGSPKGTDPDEAKKKDAISKWTGILKGLNKIGVSSGGGRESATIDGDPVALLHFLEKHMDAYITVYVLDTGINMQISGPREQSMLKIVDKRTKGSSYPSPDVSQKLISWRELRDTAWNKMIQGTARLEGVTATAGGVKMVEYSGNIEKVISYLKSNFSNLPVTAAILADGTKVVIDCDKWVPGLQIIDNRKQ